MEEFNDKKVEAIREYKYLGVLLNINVKFSKEQQEATQSSTRAMHCLIGKCKKIDLPVNLQTVIYSNIGIWLWGILYDTGRRNFPSKIRCVHENTYNDIVYGGVYPLYVDIKVKLLDYWIKLITGKREKLAYVLHQCLFHFDTARLYSLPWLKEVNNCGLSGVWLQQEVPNPVWLRKAVQQRLRDQWITR